MEVTLDILLHSKDPVKIQLLIRNTLFSICIRRASIETENFLKETVFNGIIKDYWYRTIMALCHKIYCEIRLFYNVISSTFYCVYVL